MSALHSWEIKGEGCANLVYRYTGPETRFDGLVLRIPKTKSETSTANDPSEELIWKSVLDYNQDPFFRNAAYIRDILAPRLGHPFVFPGTPYKLDGSDETGLLLPDHTLIDDVDVSAFLSASNSRQLPLQASPTPEGEGRPSSSRPASSATEDERRSWRATTTNDAGLLRDPESAQSPLLKGGGRLRFGPNICFELKPKCGFVHQSQVADPGLASLKSGIVPKTSTNELTDEPTDESGNGHDDTGRNTGRDTGLPKLHVSESSQPLSLSASSENTVTPTRTDFSLVEICEATSAVVETTASIELRKGGSRGGKNGAKMGHGDAHAGGATPEGSPETFSNFRNVTAATAGAEQHPRFVLHMLMKHVETKQAFSRYSPLDLFSGDAARMRRAVRRLLDTPSNNLRLFVDGQLLYGGRPGVENTSAAYAGVAHYGSVLEAHERLDEQLAELGESQASASVVVTHILRKEGVLDRLLAVQRLDRLGIERTHELYTRLEETITRREAGSSSSSSTTEVAPSTSTAGMTFSSPSTEAASLSRPSAGSEKEGGVNVYGGELSGGASERKEEQEQDDEEEELDEEEEEVEEDDAKEPEQKRGQRADDSQEALELQRRNASLELELAAHGEVDSLTEAEMGMAVTSSLKDAVEMTAMVDDGTNDVDVAAATTKTTTTTAAATKMTTTLNTANTTTTMTTTTMTTTTRMITTAISNGITKKVAAAAVAAMDETSVEIEANEAGRENSPSLDRPTSSHGEIPVNSPPEIPVKSRPSKVETPPAAAATAASAPAGETPEDEVKRKVKVIVADEKTENARGKESVGKNAGEEESLSEEAVAAAVRDYLISATAKDCGIMVSFRRVMIEPTKKQNEMVKEEKVEKEEEKEEAKAEGARGIQTQGADSKFMDGSAQEEEEEKRPLRDVVQRPQLREIEVEGRRYVYKVAFVDLDMKAAKKILSHLKLERKIQACVAEHGWRLAELLGSDPKSN